MCTVKASFSPSVATSFGPPRTGVAPSEVVKPQNGTTDADAPEPAVTLPLPLAKRSQVRMMPVIVQVPSGAATGLPTAMATVADDVVPPLLTPRVAVELPGE